KRLNLGALIKVLLVHFGFLLCQQLWPEHGLCRDGLICALVYQRCLNRHAIGIIALEVSRVDFDFLDNGGVTQFDNTPVIARIAPAASFPAVTHIDAPTRHDEPEGNTKVRVVIADDTPARRQGRYLMQGASVFCSPVAQGLAINPEARHAAIGIYI